MLEVCALRLLDHIAQCAAPFVVRQDRGDIWRLTGAADFAQSLMRCPLRYVLADYTCAQPMHEAAAGTDEAGGPRKPRYLN